MLLHRHFAHAAAPRPTRRHYRSAVIVLALTLAALAAPAAHAQDQRCFPETGQCISGRLRAYWEQNGGLPVFGYPTTPQQEELVEGVPLQVQWFERNRLELHPDNARPYDVLLGRLGVDRLTQQGRDWFTFPKGSEQPGCRFFAATGHAVCGAFLNHFRANGLNLGSRGITEDESLALFGLPLSEAAEEVSPTDGKTYLTQHFERARMEFHPENQPPYTVLLGLLGNEIRANGSVPAPAAAPAPAPAPAPPAQIVITGSGKAVTEHFMPPSALNRIVTTHSGARNFIVWAFFDDGERDLIANTIGDHVGARPLAGQGVFFEVNADGPWTITIDPLGPDPGAAQGAAGTGEYVSGLFAPARRGPVPYTFSHDGARNVIIWLRCAGGEDLVLNEIGALAGSGVVEVEDGPCFWDVRADGAWSVLPK